MLHYAQFTPTELTHLQTASKLFESMATIKSMYPMVVVMDKSYAFDHQPGDYEAYLIDEFAKNNVRVVNDPTKATGYDCISTSNFVKFSNILVEHDDEQKILNECVYLADNLNRAFDTEMTIHGQSSIVPIAIVAIKTSDNVLFAFPNPPTTAHPTEK